MGDPNGCCPVRVPPAAWVEPISREIAQMVKEAVGVAAGEGKPPADLDLRASSTLQIGSCLVGVSHPPDRLLPKALRLLAQKQIACSPIDMSLAIEAMRKCMLGNLPPHASDSRNKRYTWHGRIRLFVKW